MVWPIVAQSKCCGEKGAHTKRAEQNNGEEGLSTRAQIFAHASALYFIFVDLVSGRTGSVGGARNACRQAGHTFFNGEI